jgi:hypothetical protein
MRLTVNRIMPNGGINAITEYDDVDWCILTFPSMRAAQSFAEQNHMEFGYTNEVAAQLVAEGIGAPTGPPTAS